MVLHGTPRIKAVVAVAVALSLFSVLPVTNAHSWYGISFHPPTEGMIVEVDHYGNLTFIGIERVLAGPHEWRETAQVSLGDQEQAWAYDLETGRSFGEGAIHTDRTPIVDAPLVRDALYQESRFESSHDFGYTPTVLPESLLWGRTTYPGDAWSVPASQWWCDDVATDVHVDGVFEGEDWEDLVATVTYACAYGDWTYQEAYILGFDDPESPIASDRTLVATYTFGDQTWSEEYPLPATILDMGGDPLPFEGRSDREIWAPRDQNHHYAPVDLFPEDPDPHPFFDVTEAGTYALGIEEEPVRIFLANAEEVDLLHANLWISTSQMLYWNIAFIDDKGNILWVDLQGLKLAGRLVVTSHWTAMDSSGWVPGPSPEIELAAPGDLARTSDRFLQANGREATSYSLEIYGSSAGYFVGFQGPQPELIEYEGGAIWVDATTGMVNGHLGYESQVVVDEGSLLP